MGILMTATSKLVQIDIKCRVETALSHNMACIIPLFCPVYIVKVKGVDRFVGLEINFKFYIAFCAA